VGILKVALRQALMPTPISLVMTVYNRAHYLPLALDSVINQTYPHWQLTIWDDGSTDRSPEIAQQYAERETRIRLIKAPHTGRQYALRGAIQATEYPYLGWLDSDDLLAPETLAKTVSILDTKLLVMNCRCRQGIRR
jgi:glycosyltransferase involved in cell wall biosynthesis